MCVVCRWVLSPSLLWTHAWIAQNFGLKVSADMQICTLSFLFLGLLDVVHKWSKIYLRTKPSNIFCDAFQIEQSSHLWGTSSLCVVSVGVYGRSVEVEILCCRFDQSLSSLSLFSFSYRDFLTILALDVKDIENLCVSIFDFRQGMFGHFHHVDATKMVSECVCGGHFQILHFSFWCCCHWSFVWQDFLLEQSQCGSCWAVPSVSHFRYRPGGI